MARSAMEAIGEDETAAASVASTSALPRSASPCSRPCSPPSAGIGTSQYIAYVNPDTLAGNRRLAAHRIAVVLGGMYALLAPPSPRAHDRAGRGAPRGVFGVSYVGMAETIYGLLLIVFIILPASGIYGSLRDLLRRPRGRRRQRPRRRRIRAMADFTIYPDKEPSKAAARLAEAGRSATAATCWPSTRSPWATLAGLLPAAARQGGGEPVPARRVPHPRQAAHGGGAPVDRFRGPHLPSSRPARACTGRPTATTAASPSTS